MDYRDLKRQIHKIEAHLQATRPWQFRERANLRIRIQALNEAGRDILNSDIVNRALGKSSIDKNNYRDYPNQVEAIYKMYCAKADYGSEIVGGLVDMRTAFLVGEGLSFTVSSNNKEKEDYLNKFIEKNNLNGSGLIDIGRYTELEGKILLLLRAYKESVKEDDYFIKMSVFPWRDNKYKVVRNALDKTIIEKFTYIVDQKENTILPDKSIYIKTAGIGFNDDESSSKICKVLTQCENISRAAYDLRNNTHLFGKIFPYWQADTPANAKAINDQLTEKSFEIGDAYAGPADLRLMEPTGSSGAVIEKDLLLNLRFVSSTTAIPIHWLAWPDLMSNRATADNLLEVTSAGTKLERLALEEGLKNLFDKVCILGVDELGKDRAILEGDITVTLPLISLAELQKLIDVWYPIYQDGDLMSRDTFMGMLPGIDVAKEKKLIEKEKKEKAKSSPFNNTVTNNTLNNIRNGGKENLNNNQDNNLNNNAKGENNGE